MCLFSKLGTGLGNYRWDRQERGVFFNPWSSVEELLGTMVRKKVPPTPAWGMVWRGTGKSPP